MESTVKIKMTLNRLIKLKTQVITAIAEAKELLHYSVLDTSIIITKWSKSAAELAEQIHVQQLEATTAMVEYHKLLKALQCIKAMIHLKNAELGISSLLLEIESDKAVLSELSFLSTLIKRNHTVASTDVQQLITAISTIKESLDKVEGSNATERFQYNPLDKEGIMNDIVVVKKRLNSLEDIKLSRNNTEIEVELYESVAKRLGLV